MLYSTNSTKNQFFKRHPSLIETHDKSMTESIFLSIGGLNGYVVVSVQTCDFSLL